MKYRSNLLPCCALAGLLLAIFARPASASTTFPGALRSKLGLAQIAGPGPGCQLCHQNDVGGLKTATKPLARSLLKAGAMGGSVPSLLAALDLIESQNTDSDHDGTADIAELQAGTDPNVAEAGTPTGEDIPLPETGCAFARPTTIPGAWAPFIAALLLLARRSRRRG
jgi:hypothetical protein